MLNLLDLGNGKQQHVLQDVLFSLEFVKNLNIKRLKKNCHKLLERQFIPDILLIF